jgi:hypothetical protein
MPIIDETLDLELDESFVLELSLDIDFVKVVYMCKESIREFGQRCSDSLLLLLVLMLEL